MKILWTDPAFRDLEAIHEYIARDSSVYADAVIAEILDRVDTLQRFPRAGRVVPELAEEHTREVIVGNYRIVYDLGTSAVTILTVLHGARLFHDPR